MNYSAVTAQAQQLKNMNVAQVIAENGGSYKDFTAGILNPIENAIARANSMAQANSARSANEARIQREWQEVQNAKAMEFNATEAVKSRNWQEYMSNTAHQREIADLKAAGLNPVLSAMGGNGAAVTSGATAAGVTSAGAKGEVDTSANQAITNLLGSMVGYMGNLASASINAQASQANAERAAKASELVAELNSWASRYAADKHLEGAKYAADHSQYGVLGNALSALVDFLGGNGDNGGSGSVLTEKGIKDAFDRMVKGDVDRDKYPYGKPGSFEHFLKSPAALLDYLFKR